MSPKEVERAQAAAEILNQTVRAGVDPNQLRKDMKTTLGRIQTGINTVGIPSTILTAGAAGGMLGGGIANLGQMVGIPGLSSNTITDPEKPGSSNTPMARTYTPTLRYIS